VTFFDKAISYSTDVFVYFVCQSFKFEDLYQLIDGDVYLSSETKKYNYSISIDFSAIVIKPLHLQRFNVLEHNKNHFPYIINFIHANHAVYFSHLIAVYFIHLIEKQARKHHRPKLNIC